MKSTDISPFRSIQRHIVFGTAIVAFILFGIGGWAATMELGGAVVAQGSLVVDSNVKKVQHLSGGIVKEIRVREGDHVKAGDILVRLDETQTKAANSVVTKNLDELIAQQARLEAERDGADHVNFPPALVEQGRDPSSDAARTMISEQKLFELRQQSREGKKGQLKERISQLKEEIRGDLGQTASKEREIDLINKELEGVRVLRDKDLVPLSRLTALERDAARIDGERGQLIAATAQAKGKITETELQIIQIDQDLRSEVGKDLGETRSKISEFVERKVATADQLQRVDIRAPQNGIVQQLAVHTVGGVVAAGDAIMLIVPDADTLTVEVKIAPQDIDQLYLGQTATLRFTAFNARTTPEIDGKVTLISADITQDQRSGISYYTARIALDGSDIARLGEVKLIPGMPVVAFIKTTERTMLSYLTRPLRDQAEKAFKEK
jgi:membrane fusion protein, type I secretion system